MKEYIVWIDHAADGSVIYHRTLDEIVRCKDCEWYEIAQLKKDGTDDRRYKPSFCTLYKCYQEPDYFCADGERKEKR